MSIKNTLATISSFDLANVVGGAAQETWAQHLKSERAGILAPLKTVACTTAGAKAGPEIANGMFANATGQEMIGAAEAMKNYCLGDDRLPTAAKPPF